MAIVLTLPDEFAIENYLGLQEFLVDHLELSEATAEQLPLLIRLAELRLNRLILAPEREITSTLVTVATEQDVSLPDDFRQMRQLKITGDHSTGYPLDPVTLNVVETYDYPGKPVAYAVTGALLRLGPVPDVVYTLGITYIAELSALTLNSQTNWLLRDNADAYVYMAAAVVNMHLGDGAGAQLYLGLANEVIDEVNKQGIRKRSSVPIRLRSPGIVV